MTIHPMSPADAAWFHNDGPANLAIVTGVLLTGQPLDFATVRDVYRERLLAFPRFRQRVVERGVLVATPCWEDIAHFDIDQHLHHIGLPRPYDEIALRALISDIASMPLDHGQPLWQAYVVDNVEGGSALIMRCHHCIADGTAMMRVARNLFDSKPGVWRPTVSTLVPPPPEGTGFMALVDTAIHVAARPQDVVEKAATLVAGAGMLIGELVKKPDPTSPLKGEFGMGKRVAWTSPVALRDVKAIGSPHGAKVNDVLVAAMTGALRSYLLGRGVDANHTTLRAMVPVDLRSPDHADPLGNAFGLVLLELPISTARSDQRLALTKVRMDALKRSSEPVAARALLDVLGRVPKAVEDFSNRLFASKASLVVTNVAGPSEVLYLAGVPIDRMLGWAPHPGTELGMAISILSYRAMVTVTVISDAHLLPDPERIVEHFHHEFQVMLSTLVPGATKLPMKKSAVRKAARPRK